jgi:formylmethanofuran dehydrogenase subunit B
MAGASIGGMPASLEAAVAAAAHLLSASRLPVIAGLGTDVAGARAAIALAERLGGAVDHMNSTALLRDLDIARAGGMMVTTPNEARLRADRLLLIGSTLVTAWPELPTRLLVPPQSRPDGAALDRRVAWLSPGPTASRSKVAAGINEIGCDAGELPDVIAALRARIAGRSARRTSVDDAILDALAGELRGASFGVAVWSAAELDALALEMLAGLVSDLNAETRFTGLPLAPPDNAWGVLQACGWMTGFPMRTGFGRGYPEHDPWRFDANRLIESGEADGVIWISAYRPAAPQWQASTPVIALTGPQARFRRTPHVHIAVGRPGIDHDAIEYFPATGTLAMVAGKPGVQTISVAQTLALIAAAIPDLGALTC